MSAELAPFRNRAAEITIESDCLLWGHRVIIPSELQGKVLKQLHGSHPGICHMKALARSYVWWPQKLKYWQRAVIPAYPLNKLHLPLLYIPGLGRLNRGLEFMWTSPVLSWGKCSLLLWTPTLAKWPEVFEMKSTTAQSTINILRLLFSSYGLQDATCIRQWTTIRFY